jgi:hypothetical protein
VTSAKIRPFSLAGAGSLLALVALPILGVAVAGASTPSGVGAHATTALSFPPTTVGDILGPQTVTIVNSGTTTITGFTVGGANPDDFIESDGCTPLAPSASCNVQISFVPGELGLRQATLLPLDGTTTPASVALSGTGTEGYYEITAQGAVSAHGDAQQFGDTSTTHLTQPIVASAATGDDAGYWLAAADGGIFTFGDAGYFGSTGAIHLNKPIVGMAATIDAMGYWLVASDGGIFTFGDAQFFGSTGAIHLNKPIVGLATTPDGLGYWLVASDGGIFSFGDAPFLGSTGAINLNKPIVGLAATPDGLGYWLVASDGGIFTFGDAPFDGSSASPGAGSFVSIAGDAPPSIQAILDLPGVRHGSSATQQARRG